MIAGVTFFTRTAGVLLMSQLQTSGRIERFLDTLSVSVVAALVASILAQNGAREMVAVAVSTIVMLRSRSAAGAILAGIGAAALWSRVTTG